MSDKIILRVFSKAGRSRVEISKNQTLTDLKTELSGRLSISVGSLKLFTDEALKKPLACRDSATIQSLNLKNGDILHVGNQSVEMSSVAPSSQPIQPAPTKGTGMIDTSGKGSAAPQGASEKPKVNIASGKTSRCNHIATQKCVHCMSSAIEAANKENGEDGKDGEPKEEPKGRCNHASSSKCPNCIGKTGSVGPAKIKCHHGPNSKCPNCMNENEGMVADRKHEAFDKYIADMRRKCSKLHADNQKC